MACRPFHPLSLTRTLTLGYGYHVDDTKGVAKGNDPESIFAVMSGTHFNGGC